VSNVKLKKITLDLYDKDLYGSIAEMVEQALDEVMTGYGKNIRGDIEFTARNGEEFCHLATYVMNGDRGQYKYWYDSVDIYCPLGLGNCDVRMVIRVVDLNSVSYNGIAKEIICKIARIINLRISSNSQSETCYLRTIEKLIRFKNGTYTIDDVYAEADAIGVLDARLVDMVVEKLLQDEFLIKNGKELRRKPRKNYVAANIFANPAD